MKATNRSAVGGDTDKRDALSLKAIVNNPPGG